MSKINKIKVNGTPYEVEDKEAVKTVTLTQAEYDALQTKDPSIFYVISDGQGGGGGMTSGEVQTMIDSSISGKADSSGVTQEISAATSGKVDTTTFNTYSGAVDTALSGKQETLLSGTNIKTINGNSVLGSGNITISGGGSGSSAVEVTQAEYDALVSGGTLDPSVLYIITDAVGGDLSNYMTSAQTMNAISAATSTKQDILSAGTGIDITDNTISVTGGGITSGEVQDMIDTSISGKQDTLSAGTGIDITDNTISVTGGSGGGKAVAAGTNISITTGETADTINCTLPITISDSDNGSKQSIAIGDGSSAHISNWFDSIAIGKNSKGYFGSVVIGSNPTAYSTSNGSNVAIGNNTKFYDQSVVIGSYAEGYNGYGSNSVALGYFAIAKNMKNAVAIGANVSTTGTTKTNINNQLKIDTSNQVYIYNKDNTEMICLQDHLGGGGGGGLDDDTQLLLSTALTDLNDRKIDASEVKQNYQRKGDYATKSELAAKANVSDVMTLEKAKENEQVTSYALNNLNNRVTDNTTALGGMKLVKLTQSEYTALTTKDENTLYVVIADPE